MNVQSPVALKGLSTDLVKYNQSVDVVEDTNYLDILDHLFPFNSKRRKVCIAIRPRVVTLQITSKQTSRKAESMDRMLHPSG